MTREFTKIHLIDLSGKPIENVHRFAHQAMATIYEIFIFHQDYQYVQQAAAEAFRLLDQLEQELSRFVDNSDISRIRVAQPYEPVGICENTFHCLLGCIDLHGKTNGAFDITVGHLMDCFLDKEKNLKIPRDEEFEYAKQRTGLQHLLLDEEELTAFVMEAPLALDLGGYGKGYAVDQMADVLKEWEVPVAVVHGGFSSVLALKPPPGLSGWPVTISHPGSGKTISRIYLKNNALSGSGLQKGQHIIDPRRFRPIPVGRTVWVTGPHAAITDGLSTAFMIMERDEIEKYCRENPEIGAAILSEENGENADVPLEWIGNWNTTAQ